MILNAIGENLKTFHSDYIAQITAGAGNDGSEVVGNSLDVQGYESGVLNYNYLTTLTADKTLSIAVKIYQSDDNSTFDSGTALLATTVLETGAETAKESIYKLAVNNLSGYKRYIKFGITADLSATGTDTVLAFANFVALKKDKPV